METSNYSKCTFTVKVILLCLLSLGGLSCSDKEDPVPIDSISSESVWEKFLEESNIQVSNPELVTSFKGTMTIGEYLYIFGAKNYHPWISCIGKDGVEKSLFEYKDSDIKYGLIRPDLVVYNYENILLLKPILSNVKTEGSGTVDIERIDLIALDLNTMKLLSVVCKGIPFDVNYDIVHSNNKFYMHMSSTSSSDNKIYLFDQNLKTIFQRDVKDTELSGGYKNKLSILDDERIAYCTSRSVNNDNLITMHSSAYINIINLKNYELLHQFDRENLPIKGDRIDDYPENVKYTIDTLTVETDHFKFLYDEREVNKDPISGITTIGKVLDSYFYKIDPETYEILDWGKIQ